MQRICGKKSFALPGHRGPRSTVGLDDIEQETVRD